MGEAIIARASSSTSSGSGGQWSLKTEIYTSNQQWVVPEAKNNEFSVRIFGGGGAGSTYSSIGAGGGGGWMNNGILYLNKGSVIPIVIGNGGNTNNPPSVGAGHGGGSSFFGDMLSANGGTGGRRLDGTSSYSDGTSGSSYYGYGGSGGSGGGFRCVAKYSSTYRVSWDGSALNGGIGYQFGGGGSASSISNIDFEYSPNGGSGGKWGGGGGGWKIGIGGTYGGNGGTYNEYNRVATAFPENGTNTIGWTNVEKYTNGAYITGCGIAGGNDKGGGGGGFGGNGGNLYGGGGGYGETAYGGDNAGGGGGYTGHGGNNCGGGGAYGPGGDNGCDGIWGGGGGYKGNGGSGICIIQYYGR